MIVLSHICVWVVRRKSTPLGRSYSDAESEDRTIDGLLILALRIAVIVEIEVCVEPLLVMR